MASVPTIRRVGASDVKSFTSGSQSAREARGLDAPGRALADVGGAIQQEAGAIAELGVINQRRDNKREVDARVLRFKQGIHDLKFGNTERGIIGYTTRRGQDAIDNKPDFYRALDELRRDSGKGASNPEVFEAFELQAQIHALQSQDGHAVYVGQQRLIAEDATDTAFIQQLINEIEADPLDPGNHSREQGIIKRTNQMMDRKGIRDEVTREGLRMSAITSVHKAAIRSLLNKRDTPGALAYYAANETEILQTERGAIVKSLATASVTREVKIELERIIAVGGTDADMLEAARGVEDPEVSEALVPKIRAHLADRERQRVARDRQLKTEIIELANNGRLGDATPEQLNAASQVPGYMAHLRRVNQTVLEGRRYVSDPHVHQEAVTLYRTNLEAFRNIVWTDRKWLALSRTDVERFEGWQLGIDKDMIDASNADTKAKEKALRASTMRSATLDVFRGLALEPGDASALMTVAMEEVERQIDLGVEFKTSQQYRDIVRFAFMNGEHTGEGYFEDPNARAYEAIRDRVPFDIEDWKGTEEAVELRAETELSEEELLAAVADTVGRGLVPTPDVVLRQKALTDVSEMSPRLYAVDLDPIEAFALANPKLMSNLMEELDLQDQSRNVAFVVYGLAMLGVPATPAKVKQAYDIKVSEVLEKKKEDLDSVY